MSEIKKIPLVQRVEFIKNICKGKKVLHLGCTSFPFTSEMIENGGHLHLQLQDTTRELYGFDYDQEGIDILAEKGFGNLYKADLEKLEEVELDEKFDVIIAGEMIEHLNNPGKFLDGIKRFMNSDSKLVITTVNAYCAHRFAFYFLLGRKGLIEPVHPDHVAYYSFSTLSLLINRHQLNVDEFLFYDLGDEHKKHGRWYFNFINDLAVKLAPQFADGVIAVCGLGKNS